MTQATAQPAEGAYPLLFDVSDRVAMLTMNRPAARNALSSQLITELRTALRRADEDDGVDVVILTGADPGFCAGLDLKELGSSGNNLLLLSAEGAAAGEPWAPLSKPLIGAVNGVAVTGGLEVALHCDILVASERALFADTHARVGVMPAWGLSVLLPQAVGIRLACKMSLTGDYLDAEDALRAGLVTAVVPHDELLGRARSLAASIVGNDQAGVRAMVKTYHRIARVRDSAAFAIEAETSQEWLQRGFDPAEVEGRRAGILSRGRDQVGSAPAATVST